MSLTTNILDEVSRNPGATAEEIADAVKDTAVRVRQNIAVMGSPSGGLLVSKGLDEVTGRPGYKITSAGIAKLKTSCKGATPEAQPEVAKNTGSDAFASSPEGIAVATKTPVPDAGNPPSTAAGSGGGVMERMRAECAECSAALRLTGEANARLLAEVERLTAALSAERKLRMAFEDELRGDAIHAAKYAPSFTVLSAERRRHLERIGTEETLDLDEAAAVLKIDSETLSDLIQQGAIPAGKVGRRYVMLRKDVLDFLTSQIALQTAQRMGGGPVRRKRRSVG